MLGLTNSFIHVQGIGPATERKLWESGVHSWDAAMDLHHSEKKLSSRVTQIIPDIKESLRCYDARDWNHFEKCFPANQKWRAFKDFNERVLYVDIETTGMGGDDSITVIGTYNGRDVNTFVAGRNLEDAVDDIEPYPLIVTYNGASFDMPMIRQHFRYNTFNHIHIDLRFPLHALGLKGGLKHIEQQMGIVRSGETQGMDGWDAVRLWYKYLNGSEGALQQLVAYNREDIVNLKPLMEYVYEQMSERVRFVLKD